MATNAPQPLPSSAEPISANSLAWRKQFDTVWKLLSSLIAEQGNLANASTGLGVAGDFVTLNANGDLQDAGLNPSLAALQHNHSNAATGGNLANTGPSVGGGVFTLLTGQSNVVVSDANVTANSAITFSPTNANGAGLIQSSTLGPYEVVANRAPGASFTIQTYSGGASTLTANYQYVRVG